MTILVSIFGTIACSRKTNSVFPWEWEPATDLICGTIQNLRAIASSCETRSELDLSPFPSTTLPRFPFASAETTNSQYLLGEKQPVDPHTMRLKARLRLRQQLLVSLARFR